MRTHGNDDWQTLTTSEDLQTGDVVRTGLDGRVEMLLNPGSYLRLGEDSEIELTDNSLENLEVRLTRGTAIVEVTGADDSELLINISTPHTRMAIVRRGLYRVNVIPGDATELIVRKGRVMLERTHTKIKGGDKVVFNDTSFSVAKLRKSDKMDQLEAWSKERAQKLVRANSRISIPDLNNFLAYNTTWQLFNTWSRRTGFWLFDAAGGFFTFFPFTYGCGSPYGSVYGNSFYAGFYFYCRACGRGNSNSNWPPVIGSGSSSGSGNGNGSGGSAGYGGGSTGSGGASAPSRPISAPVTRNVVSPGPSSAHRPDTP